MYFLVLRNWQLPMLENAHLHAGYNWKIQKIIGKLEEKIEGVNQAAKAFCIPKFTLKRRIKILNVTKSFSTKVTLFVHIGFWHRYKYSRNAWWWEWLFKRFVWNRMRAIRLKLQWDKAKSRLNTKYNLFVSASWRMFLL